MLLPAAVSALWAAATLFTKRRATRAQLLLSLMLLMVGFATAILMVFFRGMAGSLFIYDYIFELVSLFCAPLYFLGICALTEPRGTLRRQRRVFWLPLAFVIGLTVGADVLGPRRYEAMCHAVREAGATFVAGDAAYNYMLFWDHMLYPVLMLAMSFVLLLVSNRKYALFCVRYNSFYADQIGRGPIHSREVNLATWSFLPLGLATVLIVDFHPQGMKYWLIVVSLLLAAIQWFVGRAVYNMDYDSRYLSGLVRHKMETPKA